MLASQSSFTAAASLGKCPRFLGDLAQLVVQRLDRVGGVDHLACGRCEVQERDEPVPCLLPSLDLSCRSLVTQDFLDYCCGVGGYVGLGGDGLTGDLDGDLA